MKKIIDTKKSSGYFIIQYIDDKPLKFNINELNPDNVILNEIVNHKPDIEKLIILKKYGIKFKLLEKNLNLVFKNNSSDYKVIPIYNESNKLKENKLKYNKNNPNNIFLDIEDCINYFYYYYPSDSGKQDSFSLEILVLKEYKDKAFNFNFFMQDFYNYVVYKLLEIYDNLIICSVPSSDKENHSVMSLIIKKMCTKYNIKNLDGSNFLIRNKSIPPAHKNNESRNFEIQYESISVVNKELIKNKVVLLIDDIYTTGTSLKACKKKLENSGAEKVLLFTFSKTKR